MPTTRRPIMRAVVSATVPTFIVQWLRDGVIRGWRDAFDAEVSGRDALRWHAAQFMDATPASDPASVQLAREAWEVVRDELLREYARRAPGMRPYGWWAFDAPRLTPAEAARLPWAARLHPAELALVCDPRRRVGGTGTACRSAGIKDLGAFGLPESWELEPDIDPEDPPTFESEAAYLKRHGLLTASEAERLKPEAFAPVAIHGGAAPDAA